jgi:hypothetical protein
MVTKMYTAKTLKSMVLLEILLKVRADRRSQNCIFIDIEEGHFAVSSSYSSDRQHEAISFQRLSLLGMPRCLFRGRRGQADPVSPPHASWQYCSSYHAYQSWKRHSSCKYYPGRSSCGYRRGGVQDDGHAERTGTAQSRTSRNARGTQAWRRQPSFEKGHAKDPSFCSLGDAASGEDSSFCPSGDSGSNARSDPARLLALV